MSKGYLRSLLQYLSSVYDISGKIKKLLQVEVIERIIKEMVVYDARDGYLIDTG